MHRDIKPANIMFRENNSAVLMGFGIARLQGAGDQLTQAGTIIGTPTYMSPEAIKGREPDGRSDIYSLGIVFYEMLMKVAPYKATEFTALAVKHIQDPIPELQKVYAKYQGFLNKILAEDPKDRFQSGREIKAAIKELQQAERKTEVSVDQPTEEKLTIAPKASSPGEQSPLLASLGEIKEGISFDEKVTRKAGLFKSYILICNFNIGDAHSLSLIFTQASDKLIDWHKQRNDHIDSIEFNFLTEAWCFERADEAINGLYQAGGIYDFLKKISIRVNMVNYDGSTDNCYVINKKGEKVFTVVSA